MQNAQVKLPNGAYGVVLTEPDKEGNVVVLVNSSCRKITIKVTRLTKR